MVYIAKCHKIRTFHSRTLNLAATDLRYEVSPFSTFSRKTDQLREMFLATLLFWTNEELVSAGPQPDVFND